MTVNCRDVLDAALRSSAEDREIVAGRLLETLSPEEWELSDDDLEVELERRLEETHGDRSMTAPWAELRG